jgi:hypothetical protein
MTAASTSACAGDRLFRTVAAHGAELRRQGALNETAVKIDLIDLVYAAIAACAVDREAVNTAPLSN